MTMPMLCQSLGGSDLYTGKTNWRGKQCYSSSKICLIKSVIYTSLLLWYKYFLVLFRSKNIPGHSLWFVREWVDTAGRNPRQLHHHDSGEGSGFQIHHRSYCWFFLKQIINLAKQSMSFMDKLYSNSFNNKMNMTKQLL